MKSIRTDPTVHAAEGDERPRLMVTGSRERSWDNPQEVKRGILQRLNTFTPDTIVMQGDSPGGGVDEWAAEACEITGHECIPYPADPRLPSPQRFHARNDAMLDVATDVLAVWDDKSTGTKSVIDKAKARGVRLWVWRPEQ